jgi:flagellin-specific chaperone FliS
MKTIISMINKANHQLATCKNALKLNDIDAATLNFNKSIPLIKEIRERLKTKDFLCIIFA